jgi:hypothetical protein
VKGDNFALFFIIFLYEYLQTLDINMVEYYCKFVNPLF